MDALGDVLATVRAAGVEVVTDADVLESYGTDWTRRWRHPPLAVLRPRSTVDVARALLACAERGMPVVTQGGNTGLVGGSVPHGDAVVLSTRALDSMQLDQDSGRALVGAGVLLGDLQRAAGAAGWSYGVDLAARESATVGGTVATNAGGLYVVRHGDTKAQVLGAEAVLADGSVVRRLDGLPKDGAGYDLTGLLVGSEGTLAVITRVLVRLVRPDPPGAMTLVGCQDAAAALALLPRLRTAGLRLAELMLEDGMALVCEVTGLRRPMPVHPVYVLAETDELPSLPEDADAVVGDGLLAYRERQTEAVATLGEQVKLDVAVPLARLAQVLGRLDDAASPHRVVVFGHLAEGNLHLQLVGAGAAAATEPVLRLVAEAGGSVASEHGVGVAKTDWLGLTRSRADLTAMAALKRALDPTGILNPGVLIRPGPATDATMDG